MVEERVSAYHFLQGGGELGGLTRTFDWSKTSAGPVDQWPQSLRTMVDLVLHSQVPMLLLWGNDMIQFYNDAFRSSLGHQGKHPMALGQKAKDCWPESWSIIGPLLGEVRDGGAIWQEDRLLPFFRDGRIEEVYWTFGYTPVRDDAGVINGVLVVCNETTQQVRTKQKITESEKTLRSIVLQAAVGICILEGEELQTEVVNDIFLELIGKSRDHFEDRPIWESAPEFKDSYAALLRDVMSTGVAAEGKEQRLNVLRHGRDETIFVDFVVEPLRLQPDQPIRKLMVMAVEVTDKVLSRKSVEESEQRYRTLITESTVAIALYIGPELRIQYVNDIMTGYWGKDSSVRGKTLAEAVPEIEGQGFLEKIQAVFATGRSYTGTEEEARLRVDGKIQSFYFNYIYKALRDADGQVYGIHHMAMDVTEQVLARKKIEQSEATLRNIILSAPVAICILKGPDLVVEVANERMFRLWGKTGPEILHKPIFVGLPEAKDQGFEDILEMVCRTGKTFSADAVPISLPRNNGIETVYVNFVYEPYREAGAEISGVIAVATEVTDQVHARQKVEQLVKERTRELWESNNNLKRSNDELAQFAYIASHDLQEPARKISTFTEMLKKSLKQTDPRSENLLEKIEHASFRMLSLIRDVLAFSQLAKETQQFRKLDLNHVLQSVRNDFELLIEEKDATISSDNLPVIDGIPVQINQLFGNLISNALKFTRKETPPQITISCAAMTAEEAARYNDLRRDLHYYRISFRDNGIGFSQGYAQQIFDIFQRLHGKSEYEGTGIGLAMCKKIAQNHQGGIYAVSEPGRGATFHVLLPAEQL